VRVANAKLVRIPEPDGIRWEAYDLAEDPAEMHDVFEPRRHGHLRVVLERWLQSQRERGGARRRAPASALDRDTVEELRGLGYLN
jgi:hypothetical protein